jgi:hypothetical protein
LRACREQNGYRATIDHRSQNALCLLLQQTTKFSLLDHLRLPLVPANDERIKGYISNEAKRFKAAYEASLEEINHLQQELETANNETGGKYSDLKREFAGVIEEHDREIEVLSAKYEVKLDQLR